MTVQIDEVNDASTVAHVVVNGVRPTKSRSKAPRPLPHRRSPRSMPASQERQQCDDYPRDGGSFAPSWQPSAPSVGVCGEVPAARHGAVGQGRRWATPFRADQTLVVLEAMKMENNIDADRAGVVKQVLVQQGATVMEGDNLIVIE